MFLFEGLEIFRESERTYKAKYGKSMIGTSSRGKPEGHPLFPDKNYTRELHKYVAKDKQQKGFFFFFLSKTFKIFFIQTVFGMCPFAVVPWLSSLSTWDSMHRHRQNFVWEMNRDHRDNWRLHFCPWMEMECGLRLNTDLRPKESSCAPSHSKAAIGTRSESLGEKAWMIFFFYPEPKTWLCSILH